MLGILTYVNIPKQGRKPDGGNIGGRRTSLR